VDGPEIFWLIGQHLDTALNPFIGKTVGKTIPTSSLFFIGFVTIHLAMMGYASGWGTGIGRSCARRSALWPGWSDTACR